ncbi:DNA primase, partial [Sulfolobus sp. E3]
CALLDSEDRRQIAEYVMGVDLPEYDEGPGWAGREKKVISIDEQVTIDTKRLVRIPNSIHGKSGLIVKELKSLDRFSLDESLSPFSGFVVFLPYINIETEALGRVIKLQRGIPIKLEAGVGVYLHLKSLGEMKGYVR